ncbi:putative DNA polymerase epsilon subunit C [Rhexocercosporidium sp. MPI-PUGE-AT-0058]|nr:putative DNA polymerase epsilon subunit C [Rhexocercosporidium sp. MPI-PUGE-AT-0058]
MSSRDPRIKSDALQTNMHTLPTYTDPNPLNIEIRTKFPVARIKRIMQADEEVGKVAQVTPVAVSKALELFMIALVGGAAEKAKEKGGKKVTATHLKAVVLGSEQFDFLAEIVGRVAEVQEGAGGEGRKRKGKEEKDSESTYKHGETREL